MVTIIFDSASPALGSDVFADDPVMSRYTRGKLARKVLFIGIMGGTVGTGKFSFFSVC